MDCFFDKNGRDRIIHDWLKTNKPDFVPLYEYALSRFDEYKNFNAIFLMAFEAGIEFAKVAKSSREVKVEYEYDASFSN